MTAMPIDKKNAARRSGKSAVKPSAVKRPVKRISPAHSNPGYTISAHGNCPVPIIDMSRCEAFRKLSLEERRRRNQAFIDALAPAFADYSSSDFRADQRREAERDS